MRGQRIFLTGGTGFFGRWLTASFAFVNQRLDLQAQLVVLTRNSKAFASSSNIEIVAGDMSDFNFPSGNFSHIIHAATETNTPAKALFESNVNGTRRVLQFAARARVKKLLFTSSGAVYGPQPTNLDYLSEGYSASPAPDDAYGQSKRAAEVLCQESGQQYGFDAVIARCFAFVGPYLPLDRSFAIGNFIRDALAGGPIKVKSDGKPIRSYLYAADLAIWLWTILLRGQAGRSYNVGAQKPYTIAEVAQIVAEEVNPQAVVQFLKNPIQNQLRERYLPSTRRAEKELGLESWIDLRESIRRTADWHRATLALA